MRAAPAFELDVTPGRFERAVVAMIGGACTATVAAWVWSYVDASAGPGGRGALAWVTVTAAAAVLGLCLGWMWAPRSRCRLAWRQGQWTLCRPPSQPFAGTVQAKLDVGSWLLLSFRPSSGGATCWLGVNRRDGGPAWHALRATLFEPGGVDEGGRAPDEGVRP